MPKAFLNHKTQDKAIVKEIEDYLKSCFIETWLDEAELLAGKKLLYTIYDGMNKSAYFIAFISARYLKSDWCTRELEKVMLNDKKVNIIPVLMEKPDEIKKVVTDKEWLLVADLLKSRTYIILNAYDIPETARRIGEAIWSDFPVRFKPLRTVQLNNIEAQLIHYDTEPNVPLTLLNEWDFNIEKFISRNDGKDGKPIIDMPVIISGTAINWLLTNITISFYNKRDVLLYNQRDKKVVCAYTTSTNSPLKKGDVFDKDFDL